MNRTIRVASGHTMFVKSIDRSELPKAIQNGDAKAYSQFYVVKNFGDEGVVFFYLAKGWHGGGKGAKEIVGWYPSTNSFWAGYGKNLQEAIEGLQRDGWMYA